MVKIRLKRMGAKKRPFYRLVVADSRSPRDGKFIEEIGYYDPLPNPAIVRIEVEKVHEWMRRGARPSDVARKLLEREGVLQRSAQSRRVVTAPPKAAPEPAAAAAPVAEAPAAEAPAAEAPAAGSEEAEAVEAAADEQRAEDAEEEQA
ncbi:MAG TPA: 30S ribosomal protein S16 [Candidatus Dormibacteraeota bacterium]|nr:30S ribosomal protein S16 [Candidatus Dormibacteraeota bacterium]